MRSLVILGIGVFTLLPVVVIHALDNGLALTPPMGWLSWERFRCNIDCKDDPDNCISEKLYRDMADRMASDGWLQAGYRYVNIDDCWAAMNRSSNGSLVADPIRFPSGIHALAQYAHERGLELGIYGDLGSNTCGGYPGTPIDKVTIDANTFAAWEVDSLKLDGCNIDITKMPQGYPAMTKALNATGRHILYACSWPAYWLGQPIKSIDWSSIQQNCNYWRLFDDIEDDWDSVKSIIKYWGDNQDVLAPLAGPGHFNDPDMIICGNFALSVDECIAQFSLWAIFAAPLYLSADLRSIKAEYRDILLNTEVIAVNQDSLGKQGMKIYDSSYGQTIWVRPLSHGDLAIALLNEDSQGTPTPVSFNLSMIGYTGKSARIRDLYAHIDMGVLTQSTTFSAQVNVHSARMFRITAASNDEKGLSMEELHQYGVVMDDMIPEHINQPVMVGGGDHDMKPHQPIGGGDHDKQPHHLIGGGDHDMKPHQPIIGGGDHDQKPHQPIGGGDHDMKPHQPIGGGDHDSQPHKMGGGDHDRKPHRPIGGGSHDKRPHKLIGGGDHDTQRHQPIGEGDHDKQPHHLIGGGDQDKKSHQPIGGGSHDAQPHQPIGGGDHDQKPPHLNGGDDHDQQAHTLIGGGGDDADIKFNAGMFGGDDHDAQPHQLIGGGDHDTRPHQLIGGGDHDKQPHQPIGGGDHDKQPHALIGGDGHDEAPHAGMFGGNDADTQPHQSIGGGDNDKRPRQLIGGGDHDQKPHRAIGGGDHDKKPHQPIGGGDHDMPSHHHRHHRVGGGDHDNKPHQPIGAGDHDAKPLQPIGGGDHDNKPHQLIGGGDHDQQSHSMIGEDGHDTAPHQLIGRGDHDQQPHHEAGMLGGDPDPDRDEKPKRSLLGANGHGRPPVIIIPRT